ncbi:efflux RND transporter permease subunit [Roseomonas sp. OT10]|uniref:efflux RND transporter permease subunit n=1 Tax=Roseomonas cutis TaxID=2897332 RepID=UPI001E38355A|nr:efflux RND transporter permease subunit [Roseomonas sp. OT10]UFN48571.1 efflux RND transporter permease subunit [Roseomonas sp. OT10]
MKRFNLSEWALNHRSIVVYMMIVAIAAGTLAFLRLGRAEDPVFTIRTMVVQANWPGASMEDTLNQVTERLERRLQETEGLDRLRSFTRPGQSLIFIDLLGSTSGARIPDIWYEVRKKVGDMRHTLPAGVQGPFFNDEFGDTFGIIYGFTADGFTHRELRDFVEDARSELLKVPDVSRIEMIGAQDERVFVEFSMENLSGLGIDRAMLIAALQAQNIVAPAGTIEGGPERLLLRVSGQFESEQDIRAVNFSVGGRILRLSDIAEVRRGFADPPQPMFRVNGREAIGLGIAMRDGGDVLQLGQNIDRTIRRIVADLPVGVEAHAVAEQPRTVDIAIGEFMESLWQAIAIILVVSFIALGVRPGAIVAIAIPLTLAIVFPIMQAVDIDLQRISLGALIIALALMVDDAMTTVDAMISRLAAGDTMEAAGTYAYSKLAFSMLAGTLVTIAGFVPVGFAQSSAGEYTFSIFAVVAIALLVSWFVAVIFAPLIGVLILKRPKPGAAAGPGRLVRAYQSFLGGAIRLRWVTLAATLLLFGLSVAGMRLVSQQFFPASDRNELLVDLTLPQNASIHATDAAVARLEELLAHDPQLAPEVAEWSSNIGRGAIRFYLPLDVQPANDFFAQMVVISKGLASRERLQDALEKVLAEQFPEVVSRVYPLELGPPVGWPIQYRVSGPDVEVVRGIAMDLARIVAGRPETRRTSFDWMEPARQLRVRVDQDEARRLGLSSAAVASALNAAISGTTVTQMRDGIYLINVVVRAVEAERMSVDTLRTLQIPIAGGRTVPLSQFATFDYEQEYPLIHRRNREPTLTVQADLPRGVLPNDVVEALAPAIAEAAAKVPPGYRIETGGIVEESARSQASVAAVVPAMLFIMATVLIFHLKTFARLFLVISVVPLGLIGVVIALLASNSPLGFVAILGVLSLMGMIAKNAVILISQIEDERAAGHSVREAAVLACSSRLRPILLTAMSTVLGMIPITPTVFWGPMAFAIMGGLMGGTLLTLVFLPVLYVTWFESRLATRAG